MAAPAYTLSGRLSDIGMISSDLLWCLTLQLSGMNPFSWRITPGHTLLSQWTISFRRRNLSNGLASIFHRHEPNRTCLVHSRKKGRRSFITPRNNSAVGKLSYTDVEENTLVPHWKPH
ncbi:hypothetical protein AVEN_267112-1 [Araneus ventricosus]|uniref:Uncharacterized protein n=1 Tax=Araneus ventricosus TaxID=182803 RepID=A0A4Y2WC28_ARAVE|nr:hypothetical protein AVEN_267112-1 [Araneus ventricosus]